MISDATSVLEVPRPTTSMTTISGAELLHLMSLASLCHSQFLSTDNRIHCKLSPTGTTMTLKSPKLSQIMDQWAEAPKSHSKVMISILSITNLTSTTQMILSVTGDL